MEMKTVTLSNQEKIAYRKRPGGEQVVILVHGNMTSSKHWDLLIENLDSNYTVFAPDLRGFGESTYLNRISSIRDFSNDLKEFVDILSLRDFHLIGWSTGGAVAMQFTADFPGLCKKLVLLASASTRGYPMYKTKPDGTPDLEKRLQTIEEIEVDGKIMVVQKLYDTHNREGLKAIWNALIYTHHQPDEKKYKEYLDDMFTQRNLADVYNALNRFNISSYHNRVTEGSDQAKDIQIPVMILHGERDFVVTKAMTEEIREDLGDQAIYVPLKDTGHSPLIDNLDELTNHIEEFLG
ncbi:hydrolase or acyltransferase [Bacillus sp. OxB-1]|uniref:intracellular short-chain-length polyhydroxyalkanoate depolymerase n=1 Tax=Bacillus sp. (strain OxB-1) TaxID=98228 RepID=UPI000581ED7B|nr:alpha/beta hydrolase [Bacillus sp. OxB-1]BAQ11074.1 hydrolase or acyltransferase [Bacillus sp. OxB-1]